MSLQVHLSTRCLWPERPFTGETLPCSHASMLDLAKLHVGARSGSRCARRILHSPFALCLVAVLRALAIFCAAVRHLHRCLIPSGRQHNIHSCFFSICKSVSSSLANAVRDFLRNVWQYVSSACVPT
jgi:hypothetical protein